MPPPRSSILERHGRLMARGQLGLTSAEGAHRRVLAVRAFLRSG